MTVLDYERDFILSDPSLSLYIPFRRKDKASFMSDDRYGHLVTRTGAIWTPNGALCDGSGDYFTVPAKSSLSMADGWTLAITAKLVALPAASGFLLNKYIDGTHYFQFSFLNVAGAAWHQINITGGTGDVVSVAAIVQDVFEKQVYTFTMNTNDFKFFIGKDLVATDTSVSMPNLSSATLEIGGGAAINDLNCYLSDIALFNRALSPLEVYNLSDYLSGKVA